MTWDSQNRMVSCTKAGVTSAYTYGADGLRRSSTVSGITTYYVYDGQTLIREMKRNTQTGALFNTATYLQGPRGGEYRRDDTQTEIDSQHNLVSVCRWYVYDGLGSVVGEVDPAGKLTSSPKYDVYGAVRGNAGTASTRQGFVGGLGHVSDAETGLVYMRARYYDPTQGRFASQDPGVHGNNWYIYCDNNPVNEVDATGKSPFFAAIGIILLFALASAFLAGVGAAIFNATSQFVATGHVDLDQVENAAIQGAEYGAVAGIVLGIVTVLGAGAALLAGAGAIASVALGAAFLYGLALTILIGAYAGACDGEYNPHAPPPE